MRLSTCCISRLYLGPLHKHKLYAKLSKCKFVKPEFKFLGHIIGADGIRIDKAEIAIVKDWPVPKDKQGVQNFYGRANYFHRSVLRWAKLVAPLQKLLKNIKRLRMK